MVEREHGVGGQEVRRVKLSSVGCRWRSACSVQRSGGPWGEMLSGCRGFLAHDEHRKLGLFSFLKELTAVSLPGENHDIYYRRRSGFCCGRRRCSTEWFPS